MVIWEALRIFEKEKWVKCSESRSVVSDTLWPHGLYSPWTSPGQNTGVGRLSLLKGIIPTQGSNSGLPHYRQILYEMSQKVSPKKKWKAKERYTHLNAEFQRIARRDKKAFLSDQCKEIRENNRMGKTRDRFKKIRDIKGTFHPKMGTTKDRNCMDLTEAEDIKIGGKNTQKNYTKEILMTQINMIVWSLT